MRATGRLLSVLLLVGGTAAFGIGSVVGQLPIPNDKVPETVCRVLQDLKKYQGQVLEVRGEWTGWNLKDNCGPLRLVSGNHVWPHRIAIEDPEMRPEPFTDADWDGPDRSVFLYAFAGAKAELEKLVPVSMRSRAAIIVTVVGRFDVRFDKQQPGQLDFDRERNVPMGYGFDNGSPARLMMISFKDIVVTIDGKSLLQWELSEGIPKQ